MRRVPSLCLGREGWGWKKSKQSELTLSPCLSPLLAMVALASAMWVDDASSLGSEQGLWEAAPS